MNLNNSNIVQPSEKLIGKCRSGDKSAFKYFIETYQQFAFSIAFRILLNNEWAKEAVHESFIKLWKNFGKYKAENSFTTWFYKIVVNAALDIQKREKRRNGSEVEHLQITSNENIESEIVNKDLIKRIKEISRGLSQRQRIVFILIDLQCLSIDEAGKILNLKKGVVKSNLYYARKNIREKLQLLERKEVKHEL